MFYNVNYLCISLNSWVDQVNDRIPNLPKLAISFYLKQGAKKTPRPISVLLEPTDTREVLSKLFGQLGLRRTHLEYVITQADQKRNSQHVEFDEDVLMYSMFRKKTTIPSLNPNQTLKEWLAENLEKSKIEQEKFAAARAGVVERMQEIKSILKEWVYF